MVLKAQFQIVESPIAILEPITKFGGQPVWLAEPRWPLAPETGEPMLFLGQIALDRALFPDNPGTLVYLFFSADSEPLYNEAMAIVIQSPAGVYPQGQGLEFVSQATGPTIYELDADRQASHKEYRVVLNPPEAEDIIPLQEHYRIGDLDYDTGFHFSRPDLAGNKIGGQPLYIEQPSHPPEPFTSEAWLLLLQLAPTQGYWNNLQPNFYPFLMELGEFGILTVFISSDYTRSVCYIQQP